METVRKRARVDIGPQRVAHMTPRGVRKRRIDFEERGAQDERDVPHVRMNAGAEGDEEWAPEEWEEAMEQEMTWAGDADAFGDG